MRNGRPVSGSQPAAMRSCIIATTSLMLFSGPAIFMFIVMSSVRWRLVTRRGGRLAHPPKHLVPDLLPPALHLRSRLPLPRVLVLHRGVVVVAVSGPEVGLAELGEVVHGWLLARDVVVDGCSVKHFERRCQTSCTSKV